MTPASVAFIILKDNCLLQLLQCCSSPTGYAKVKILLYIYIYINIYINIEVFLEFFRLLARLLENCNTATAATAKKKLKKVREVFVNRNGDFVTLQRH